MSDALRFTAVVDGYSVSLSARPKSKRSPGYIVDYYRPDRERRRYPLGTRDADEAPELLQAYAESPGFLADIREGIRGLEDEEGTVKNPSLSKLVEYYRDVYLINRQASRKSHMAAKQILDEFMKYAKTRGASRVSHLNRPLLDGFVSKLVKDGRHPKTIHNYLTMIRAMLSAAYQAEMIDKMPVRSWAMPKIPDSEIEPLSREELNEVLRIVHEHEPQYYPIIAWMALTGNRPSDALDLRFKQVDLKNRKVSRRQVKVKKLARYKISAKAASLVASEKLRRRPKPNDHVFVDAEGKPFTSHRLYHQFTRALTRAGFHRQVNLKHLRHTFGYLLANDLDRPCRLPALQVLMGHADVTMTMRYVMPQEGAEEVEHHAEGIDLPA